MGSIVQSSENARSLMKSLPVNDCESVVSDICLEKELLECIQIGVTTFIKHRIVLRKTIGFTECHIPEFYALVSTGLAGDVVKLRYKQDCFISFRITEDNGYVANIPLTSAKKNCDDFAPLFQNKLSTRKLKGKFHLEVLFVDANKVGDQELCEKYVANINIKNRNKSYSISLLDQIKNAEKWLELARKKKGKKVKAAVTLPKYENETANIPLKDRIKHETKYINTCVFPSSVKSGPWYAIRTHLIHADSICSPFTDMSCIYAYFSIQVFNKFCYKYMDDNTHTMFEITTNDGHVIMSKLRPHEENDNAAILDTINQHRIPLKSFTKLYTVAIYCVDIPDFALAKNALTCINFMRKAFEKHFAISDVEEFRTNLPENSPEILNRRVPPAIELDECMKSVEEDCECEILHLSDYCTPKLKLERRSDRIIMQCWSILIFDLSINLFNFQNEFALYAMIGNRICQNTFSKEFKVGTNIQFEIMIGGKMFISKLKHHSEVEEKSIINDMEESGLRLKELSEQIGLIVYVVDILEFETNNEAYECVNNFRKGKYEAEISRSLKQEPVMTPKQPPAKIVLLVNGLFPLCTLNSSYFKIGSSLADKASTDLLKLNEAYEVLLSRTTIDTSKSKIFLFLVEIDPQFHRDALSPLLLMANICLDIVSENEILLGKKKKITVKFHLGNNLVQVALNEKHRWNATLLMVDMCKESIKTIEVPKKFYLEIYYRLMLKNDTF